jgi:hypothetical protein
LAATLLGAAACGGGGVGTPEDAVAALARALRDGRADDAYDLMSAEYRRRVSREEFRRYAARNREELRETADALSRPEGPAEQTARVVLADGEVVELVRDGGRWRVATNLVDYYDQSTPRAALRTFVRAMERERYDVVLRLVPDADREGMTVERMREAFSGEGREEISRLLVELRGALDAPIEQVGDHATLRYGGSAREAGGGGEAGGVGAASGGGASATGRARTVRFVREGGRWKIEDPDE